MLPEGPWAPAHPPHPAPASSQEPHLCLSWGRCISVTGTREAPAAGLRHRQAAGLLTDLELVKPRVSPSLAAWSHMLVLSRGWRTEAWVSTGQHWSAWVRAAPWKGDLGPGRREGPAFQSWWAGEAQAQEQPGATAAPASHICPHLSFTLVSEVPLTAAMRANERRALEVSLSVCLKLLALAVPL